jgi:general secretion pathway protein G
MSAFAASNARALRRDLAEACRWGTTTGGGGPNGPKVTEATEGRGRLSRGPVIWRSGKPRVVRGSSGFTFIELLVVTTILLILASAVMPLARVTMQRQREIELRRDLREMRTAIDKFKEAADAGVIGAFDLKAGAEGYPESLEILVEGVSVVNDQSGRKLKFLRKIPIDPITHSAEWGLRSYQDKPDATTWGGQNVFDVYTKSTGVALDGTKYRDW